MVAPPARAKANYDCHIKLLLIGDSGILTSTLSMLMQFVRINFQLLLLVIRMFRYDISTHTFVHFLQV